MVSTFMFYTQVFSPKKTGFPPIKNAFHFFLTFVYLYSSNFSVRTLKYFQKRNLNRYFVHKNFKKLAQTLLFHSPSQTTAHSPELIFHIIKSQNQTSVLLSVSRTYSFRKPWIISPPGFSDLSTALL